MLNTNITRYWIAKKDITGGKGDIEKGTILYLEKCNENNKYLSRIKQLPEGDEIQNRILMNLPALWDEFIRPATEEEISEFFEENPKLTGATNLWT